MTPTLYALLACLAIHLLAGVAAITVGLLNRSRARKEGD